MSFRRLAAIGGFAAVLFLVLNFALAPTPPAIDDPVSELGEYLADNDAMLRLMGVFGHLVGPAIALFFAGFLLKFYASDREHDEGWSLVIFFGVIITAASAAAGDSVASALALRGGEGLDAGSVRGLWDTQLMAYTGTGVGIGTIGAGTAMAVLRRGLYPSWFGWLSAAVALIGLLTVIDFLTIDTAGIFGLLGFAALIIWTMVSSILLYRESAA